MSSLNWQTQELSVVNQPWRMIKKIKKKQVWTGSLGLLTVLLVVVPTLRFLKSCGEPPYWPAICFLTSAATVLWTDELQAEGRMRQVSEYSQLWKINHKPEKVDLGLKVTGKVRNKAIAAFCPQSTINNIQRQSCMTHPCNSSKIISLNWLN